MNLDSLPYVVDEAYFKARKHKYGTPIDTLLLDEEVVVECI